MIANIIWYIANTLCDTQKAVIVLGAAPTPLRNTCSQPPKTELPALLPKTKTVAKCPHMKGTSPVDPRHCASTDRTFFPADKAAVEKRSPGNA